jgi:phospholipase/carboxylesterase
MIKRLLVIFFSVIVYGCGPDVPEVTHIQAQVVEPTVVVEPGEHTLDLGGPLLINRSISWRDGMLYIPQAAEGGTKLPLLVWLHGGGGHAKDIRHIFPIAEELGVVILTIDSRHNTWDGIDSPFGPDVLFIDAALRHTFNSVAIDPERIAIGGLSDGAAYALAIGRVNGDLFTHLIAVAPGPLRPPTPTTGQPRILVAHGIRDNVYPLMLSRRWIVPGLKSDGYDVHYIEFDGPHWVPDPVGRQILEWLKG